MVLQEIIYCIENIGHICIKSLFISISLQMNKKIIVIWLSVMMFSSTFASQKFTEQENTSIDQTIKQSIQSGTATQDLAKLKKQISILSEISVGLSYSIKTGAIGYAVAKYPTPVLHYPLGKPFLDKSFGADPYTGLNLDDYQQIDELDFVALSGTVFSILDKVQTGWYTFYQVRTREFAVPSADQWYYIDSRFVDIKQSKPAERKVRLPSLSKIYQNLLSASGTVYVRWGNVPAGIQQLSDFYPSTWQTTDMQKGKKILKWVDCSGLLYWSTDGYTPRNTSELVVYGTGIAIRGLSIDQIIEKVKPLDLITWAGHVMIILNKDFVIESRWFANDAGGTKIRPLKEVLAETMNNRTASNEYSDPMINGKKNFVIRHWFTGR